MIRRQVIPLKALLVFGTRWGGTVSVANIIAQALRERNYLVDVIDARENHPNAAEYDVIIVGSGIRADQWTKETLKFLQNNAEILRQKKTALFVSCQMADGEKEGKQKAKEAYLLEIAEKYRLNPVSFGLFGGFLDFRESHGLLVDIIVRFNKRNLRRNGLDTRKIYDTRNWNEIKNWATEVANAC